MKKELINAGLSALGMIAFSIFAWVILWMAFDAGIPV